jgi:hypothetical protein
VVQQVPVIVLVIIHVALVGTVVGMDGGVHIGDADMAGNSNDNGNFPCALVLASRRWHLVRSRVVVDRQARRVQRVIRLASWTVWSVWCGMLRGQREGFALPGHVLRVGEARRNVNL